MDPDTLYDIYLCLFGVEPTTPRGISIIDRMQSYYKDYKKGILLEGSITGVLVDDSYIKLLCDSTDTKVYQINKNQVIKLYRDPSLMKEDYRGIKLFQEHNIPLFRYKECMIWGSEALIMEKLECLDKSDAIPMLYKMIDTCFLYKDHFCHSDIKPSNIMKRKNAVDGSFEYLLIDLDISSERWMYGFKRVLYSYNASQSSSYYNIITAKQEILEFINAAISLASDNVAPARIDLYGKQKHMLGPVLLVAMNIDERNISHADHELLTLAIEDERAIKKIYKYLLIGLEPISNTSLLAIIRD